MELQKVTMIEGSLESSGMSIETGDLFLDSQPQSFTGAQKVPKEWGNSTLEGPFIAALKRANSEGGKGRGEQKSSNETDLRHFKVLENVA